MENKTLTKADLAQFTGTEKWYRHGLIQGITYTDGIKYMAETAGAYWLIDEIVFNQIKPKVIREEFQTWKLKVDLEKERAVLTCDDGNGKILFTKRIWYTDFPLDEITIFVCHDIIHLPSEY